MSIREPCAPHFYSGDIEMNITTFLAGYEPPDDLKKPLVGIVPHAGWIYSGSTAAKVFSTVKKYVNPKTIILLGTVHNKWKIKKNSVYPDGAWETPIGSVAIDERAASRILDGAPDVFTDSYDAHDGEHSIEVQIPFIKYLFPDAMIVPIAVLPDENAHIAGEKLSEILKEHDINAVVVGSTDLTHYGANYGFSPAGVGSEAKKWMEKNDRSIIEKALKLEADKIVEEAQDNYNACGSGALAAAVAFAKNHNAERGILIEYTTSYDVIPESVFSMAVGYAGIIFD